MSNLPKKKAEKYCSSFYTTHVVPFFILWLAFVKAMIEALCLCILGWYALAFLKKWIIWIFAKIYNLSNPIFFPNRRLFRGFFTAKGNVMNLSISMALEAVFFIKWFFMKILPIRILINAMTFSFLKCFRIFLNMGFPVNFIPDTTSKFVVN